MPQRLEKMPRSIRRSLFSILAIPLLVLCFASSATKQIEPNAYAQNPAKESNQVYSNQSANAQTPIPAEQLWHDAEVLRSVQQRESNQRAIEKYQAAAALWFRNGKFESAARARRCAGEVFQILGNLADALKEFKQALEVSRTSQSKVEEARALNGLAYASFLQGDPRTTHDDSSSALKIARLLRDRQLEAISLSNLAESYFGFGDLPTAQQYQTQASDLFSQLGDKTGYALSQTALAYYSAKLGEPQAALEHLRDALTSAEQAKDLRMQALALNAMGNIKAKLGRNQEALDAYAKAQPICERVGDQLFLASVLGGTGSLYLWMGEPRRALDYDERAARLFAEIDAQWGVAEGYLDIGRIQNVLGESQKALDHLLPGLALVHKLGMRRLEQQTLNEIGIAQIAQGDYETARHTFESSLNLTRTGQDYGQEAKTLLLLGTIQEKLKNSAVALAYYQRALDLSRTAVDWPDESSALFNIARLERDNGNLADAEKNLEAALNLGESIRSMVASQDLRASYLATVRRTYELYIDVLMLSHKHSPQAGLEARAFAISEKARARSFLESLQESQANIREGVDVGLLEKERSLDEEVNAKAERHLRLLAAGDKEEAEKVKVEIEALTTEYQRVRDQIRATSPRYAALRFPEPLRLEDVQRSLLDDHSALLEYALADDRSYVWLVTRTGLETFELPPRKEIEDSARRLYNSLAAYQPLPGESLEQTEQRKKIAAGAIPVESALLSKLVLGPLAGKLGNMRLLIIPDGALQYVPFQALYDPDSNSNAPRSLLWKHELAYEPSASTLALLLNEARQRRPNANSVAVVADPVFEVDDPRVQRANQASTPESLESQTVKQALRDIGISADGVQIPRLLASRDEADAIMKLAPWGTGLKAVGFDATRQRVVAQELNGYRIVHFATHGMMNNDHPELSGIVLSLFDQQGHSQDGFLRLHDIYNLHLPTDLVVLSACSTALGKDVKGEGLIGLTRGFMYAGASGVVASLWKVDDQATSELMKRFYVGLFQKGLSPSGALREAQLALSQEKRWQSPYYWAGFVIQGRYDEKLGGGTMSYPTTKRVGVLAGLVVLFALITLFIFQRRRQRII